ncbi:hypothetical protein ACFY1P_20060 [Streptomyces sp. NPDC001407]|uniref:hypothetical protein n=1 Tax=Streptomyces sp. NPDC001407 TaxID=3364573 RepID=UPI0036D1ABE2
MAIPTADRGQTRRGLRAVSWGAAALACALVLSGCGSGSGKHDESLGDDPATPGSSATVSASASASASADPQEAAKAEVITVYRKYWDEQLKAYAKASPADTDLNKYAFDKALSKTKGDLISMQQKGNVLKGEVKIDPKVTSINLGETPKTAAVTDCTDVSKWQLVNQKSGKPVELPKERLTKFITNVSIRTVGERWMVVDVQQTDRTC